MGLRGPRPMPPEIAAMRGASHHAKRPPGPKPVRSLPPPPRWLEAIAAKVYRQVVADLEDMKVGKHPDRNALIRYSRLWVRWKQADEFLQKYGETYPIKVLVKDGKDEYGEWKYREVVKCFMPFPQVALVNKLSVLLLRLEQEFGLTPSARARINVEVKPADTDPMAVLIENMTNRCRTRSEN